MALRSFSMVSFKNQDKTGDLFPEGKLINGLDQTHPLIILAFAINWAFLETSLAVFFSSSCGRPSLPIRLLAGLVILKYLYNLSDERVVAQWKENMYFQAFTGQNSLSRDLPCHPSELVHFRKRIGAEGIEIIFGESVRVNGKSALENEVVGDTTVQEKYTKFPTDARLMLDAIALCLRIAMFMGITLRRTYRKEIKKIKNLINFSKGKLKAKDKKKALSRLKTIANIILRDLQRKLPEEALNDEEAKTFFNNATKAVNQEKNDKDKIYSLYEPQIKCIAKGKAHKKYEFGNKVALVVGKNHGVILGVLSFSGNPYDGDTIGPCLDQLFRLHNGYKPKVFCCDKGYRGRLTVQGVRILTPSSPVSDDVDPKTLELDKKRLRRRSSIEPIIGHVKQDHRLGRNQLKGSKGDEVNPIWAAMAFNFKKATGKIFDAVANPFKNILRKGKNVFSKLHGLPFRKPQQATAGGSLFDNSTSCPNA
jgi:IS5 family transposase